MLLPQMQFTKSQNGHVFLGVLVELEWERVMVCAAESLSQNTFLRFTGHKNAEIV